MEVALECGDRVGVSMGGEGYIYRLVTHDIGEIGCIPFFSGRPVLCSVANYKGQVAGDVAHEFQGRGLFMENVDCGGVEVVVGSYKI